MDPQDIVDGVIRIGGIGYPQRSSCIGGYTVAKQLGECTDERSHEIALQVLREEKEEKEQAQAHASTRRAHTAASGSKGSMGIRV